MLCRLLCCSLISIARSAGQRGPLLLLCLLCSNSRQALEPPAALLSSESPSSACLLLPPDLAQRHRRSIPWLR